MRVAAVVALACALVACVGSSRWPGRALSTVTMFSGVASVSDRSCNAQCTLKTELNVDFGVLFLALGIAAFTYNELRTIEPPASFAMPAAGPTPMTRADQAASIANAPPHPL